MNAPLGGIRVLDLTWALAGPFATMIMADLGAEVIKVEQPGQGDNTREIGPFFEGISSYFLAINRGKKSLTLDLKHHKGKELFLSLIKKIDILVENFKPGVMERLGLSYPILSQHNTRLIYAACSGFGQTGPYAQKPAFDMIIQGMAGTISITGEPNRPPVRVGFSIGDIGGSLYTVIGILAALAERHQSGRGQFIDISLLDCQVSLLENTFSRFYATGELPQPTGSRHPVVTPFQAFPSKNGYIIIALGKEIFWQLFCHHIGRPGLLTDPRFTDNNLRTKNWQALEMVISDITRNKTTQEWIQDLEDAGIPCGPIHNIAQVVNNPQLEARKMFVEVEHKTAGKLKVLGTPLKLSRTPGKVELPPQSRIAYYRYPFFPARYETH